VSYWIFKCDPKKYSLSDRLANEPEPRTTWLVTRYKKEIAPGDTAFLMETGSKRAIRAIMRIDSSPVDLPELEHEQRYWKERDTEVRCRVTGDITDRVLLPIQELKDQEELQEISIFRGFQQGTNFKLTDDEGRKILSLALRTTPA
jgi:predicted RNA-binding protein with PUA-like domain